MTDKSKKKEDDGKAPNPFKPLDKNSSVMLGSTFKMIDPPKRAWKPPLPSDFAYEEPRDVILVLRQEATRKGVPWTLQDTASDIRVSITYHEDKKNGTYKRQPKFFEPLLSAPDAASAIRRPPALPEMTEEEKAAALKAKQADPLLRVHISCLNMGVPSNSAVTTNKKTNEITEASRNNVRLMTKLKLIDESAQRLQAMLREETASVPGQTVPDVGHTHARKMHKADLAEQTLQIATHDFAARRKSRGASSQASHSQGGSSKGPSSKASTM